MAAISRKVGGELLQNISTYRAMGNFSPMTLHLAFRDQAHGVSIKFSTQLITMANKARRKGYEMSSNSGDSLSFPYSRKIHLKQSDPELPLNHLSIR